MLYNTRVIFSVTLRERTVRRHCVPDPRLLYEDVKPSSSLPERVRFKHPIVLIAVSS